MKSPAYKMYLYAGIVTYLVVALFLVLGWEKSRINDLLFSIPVVITFVTHTLFFIHFGRKPVFNIESIFARLIVFGVLGFILIVIPDILNLAGIGFPPASKAQLIVELITVYIILLYLLMCLGMYRKLIFDRRTDAAIRQWQLFITLLMIGAAMSVRGLNIPPFVYTIVLVAGVLSVMPLLLRLKWIALRSGKIKWLVIVFLFITILISVGMAQKLFNVNVPKLVSGDLLNNIFFLLLFTLVIAYSSMSLLTILFNLPISSVIEEQNAEIRSFQEISRALVQKESKEDTLGRLFQVCYKNTLSSAGWLMLNGDSEGRVHHTSNISRDEIQLINNRIDFSGINDQIPDNSYYYVPDLVKERVFFNNETPFKSLLILPINYNGSQPDGVIFLIKPFAEGFDEYMIDLAQSYIDQAKLAFENAQLIEETINAERYKEELHIAREVQNSLMPANFPENEFCEISGFNESAKEVGGDYYDYNFIDNYQLAVIMGDVSGKGASAAFHMAQMKGIFQSLIQLCLPADNFLVMANNAIKHCFEKDRFITVVYLLFDFAFHKVTFSRAGHSPLLYYNAEQDTVEYIKGKGLGLGILRNNQYAKHVKAHEIKLHEGDVIVLYTDGIIESRQNNSDEQYGYERLKNSFAEHVYQSAGEIKQAILDDFKTFTKDSDFKDDTSLLVIKIKNLSG